MIRSRRRRKLEERRKCDEPINERWDNKIGTLLIADDRLVVDDKKLLTFIHFRSSLFILHVWRAPNKNQHNSKMRSSEDLAQVAN